MGHIPGYPDDFDGQGRSIRPSYGHGGNLATKKGEEVLNKARCLNSIIVKDAEGQINELATIAERRRYIKAQKLPRKSKWYPEEYGIFEKGHSGMPEFGRLP